MVEQLAQLLGIIGLDITPPETMGELLPYLFMVFLGFALLGAIIRLFRFFASLIMRPRF